MKIGTLVTLTVLLLCGFAGAQTHSFCSSDQPCTYTGNNTHSGNNTFTGPVGRQGDGEINAALMSGADMGAKMSNACAFAVTLGWTSPYINLKGFHGQQTAHTNPFASCPFTPGNAATFHPTWDWPADGTLLVDSPFVIPGDNTGLGHSRNVIGCGSGCGFTIQPSNTFVGTAVVEYGAAANFAGANPPEGIWLEGVNVACQAPNGTRPASIGIRNQFAQNHSGGRVYISSCHQCLVRDNNGGPSNTGPLNDGPWYGSCQENATSNSDVGLAFGQNSAFQLFAGREVADFIIQAGATSSRTTPCTTNTDTSLVCASASFTSADVGSVVSGTNITSGARVASVTNATTAVLTVATTGTGSGISTTIKVQPAICAAIDTKWGMQSFRGIHYEGCQEVFAVGKLTGGSGVHIEDTEETALAGGLNTDTVVHLYATNPTQMVGIKLGSIRPGGITTNLLVDDNVNGGVIAGSSQFDTLMEYTREKNNCVRSSRPDAIPDSCGFPALNSILSPTVSFTTDVKTFGWTVSSSGTTATQDMFTLRDQSGDTGNGNILKCLSANGTAGHGCFDFLKSGVADFSFSRTGNLTFSTQVAATSGANANSKTFFFTANYWTSTASAGDSYGLSNVAGTGANPPTTLTLTHVGSTGAKAVDFSTASFLAGGGSAGKAVCWKSDAKTLGFCSTVPDATGACTCN